MNGSTFQEEKKVLNDEEYEAYIARVINGFGDDGWQLVAAPSLDLAKSHLAKSTFIFTRPKQES